MRPPTALTIAGSDSGGGAGIQADLKTFHAFGVFGTSAITAVTAQNTVGVHAVHPIPADVVWQQVHAVAVDFDIAALKTGMLATRELVELVANAIRSEALPNFVLDPVMVATSGHRLLAADAELAIREILMPLCALISPNLDEARILTGIDVCDESSMRVAAQFLVERGAGAALVKGGHLTGADTLDVLFDGSCHRTYHHDRIETRSTHGTGCTLSAAIAAGLAHQRPLHEAVEAGLNYVHRAIASAPGLGSGHGPLNHFISPATTSAG